MPTWGSLYFQNSVSPIMEQLIFFHDYTMMVMLLIIILVGYLLVSSCVNKSYNRGLFEGQGLEMMWTVLPMLVLLVIAFPSLRLLYLMEEGGSPDLSIKSVGHQWFWSYEYSDMGLESFDSYMTPMEYSPMFRLLDVDNSLVVPLSSTTRMVVTSDDVIHSWTLPSVGVKADAIPGRLNQMLMLFTRVGLFSGQCSEICGSNHSFMPILVSVIPQKEFLLNWV